MDDETVPKDVPWREAFEDVARWDNTMKCFPTWEEILELEYVRQRGEINMLTENVARYCYDRGLYAAVTWCERCREHKTHWASFYTRALEQFEAERGPRDTWITEELKERFLERELSSKDAELVAELAAVRKKRRLLLNKRRVK